jgi:sRNA-binding carbon storage regulator CsrA
MSESGTEDDKPRRGSLTVARRQGQWVQIGNRPETFVRVVYLFSSEGTINILIVAPKNVPVHRRLQDHDIRQGFSPHIQCGQTHGVYWLEVESEDQILLGNADDTDNLIIVTLRATGRKSQVSMNIQAPTPVGIWRSEKLPGNPAAPTTEETPILKDEPPQEEEEEHVGQLRFGIVIGNRFIGFTWKRAT